jgi:hypothetical protein
LDAQWLTYRELAVRLGVSLEAARRRALRAKWSRQPGNDGAMRVRVPDDYVRPLHPDGAPDAKPAVPDNSDLVDALKAHNETLKGDVQKLEAQLTEANARADKAISALGKLADEIAKLAEERSRPWWRRLVG